MTRAALALLSTVLPLLAADAPRDDAPRDDADRLDGVWKVVSAEDGGRKTPEEVVKELRLTVARDVITYKVGEKSTRWRYKLDPEKKPKWIDLTDEGRVMPGIYEVDGDTLRICFSERGGDDRPTAFESKPNSSNDVLIVLKRDRPTTQRS